MLSLSRNYDLLIESDLSTFFQELARSDYLLPVTSEDELNKLVHFGREFLPESAFVISAGMTSIGDTLMAQIRDAQADRFLTDVLPIICFLYTFRDDTKFTDKIKANLANQSQFNDTFFELKCLSNFHRNGWSFQYEPEVCDGIKKRNPDFRLTKDDIELFCECKQIRLGQNKAQLEFDKQCAVVRDKFPKNLQKKLFDAKLRLEVNLRKNLSQIAIDEVDELARQLNQLSNGTKEIMELPLQRIGNSIEYLIIPQSKPSPFVLIAGETQKSRIMSMQVSIGKPFRIGNPLTNPGGEISFTSTDLTRRKTETVRDIIREAKKQLPNDKLSIMIINRVNLTIASEEIEKGRISSSMIMSLRLL